MAGLLKDGKIDMITFTSSTTVSYFLEKAGIESLPYINQTKTVSIGPQTSKKCQELGIEVGIEAKIYTIDGMIEAILETLK
jgi:uroporphyrinogen III methyltransferase/synthase